MAVAIPLFYSVPAGVALRAGTFDAGIAGTISLADIGPTGILGSNLSTASGSVLLDNVAPTGSFAGATPATYTVRQVETNGIITPGSQPSAWYRNGALYHGWVDSSGNSGVTKYTAPNTRQRVVLSSSTEYNSHNNCVIDWTADGRLIAAWSRHNSSAGVQVRIASSAESVTGGFSAAVALTSGAGSTAYANTFRLSQSGRLYAMSRVALSSQRVWSSADAVTWDSADIWISDDTQRPYPKLLSDGVGKVHLVFTSGHPSEVNSQLHHAYVQLDGSNLPVFYRTDGTLIGTDRVTPATATLAVSNSAGRTWVYDVAFGPDGVKSTGGITGWSTPVEIASVGGPLYSAETYSHAGAVFDAEDPTVVWACLRQGGPFHEVYKVTTTNSGASWVVGEQCTTGSTAHNFQIVSPIEHAGNLPWIACYGTYTFWSEGYSTEIRGWVKD